MRSRGTFRRKTSARGRAGERGYLLLTLLLFITVLVIASAAVAPEMAQQIRRDREEEMIHRGAQYARAVKRYFRKFGRYPSRLEELESTNNMRFLRRRYKDPITGGDWHLLRIGEVQLGQIGNPTISGVAVQPNASSPGPGGVPGAGVPQPGAAPLNPSEPPTQSQPPAAGESLPPATGTAGALFGGGAIVGVASTSQKLGIHEFNNKTHYNQWQFIYDPSTDRGGLINGPAQPALQGAAPVGTSVPNMTGQPGFPGGMMGQPGTLLQPTPQPQPAPGPGMGQPPPQ